MTPRRFWARQFLMRLRRLSQVREGNPLLQRFPSRLLRTPKNRDEIPFPPLPDPSPCPGRGQARLARAGEGSSRVYLALNTLRELTSVLSQKLVVKVIALLPADQRLLSSARSEQRERSRRISNRF